MAWMFHISRKSNMNSFKIVFGRRISLWAWTLIFLSKKPFLSSNFDIVLMKLIYWLSVIETRTRDIKSSILFIFLCNGRARSGWCVIFKIRRVFVWGWIVIDINFMMVLFIKFTELGWDLNLSICILF